MLSKDEITLLSKTELFAGIDGGRLARFAKAASAQKKSFPKKERIIFEGGENDEIYTVISGEVIGERNTADGRTLLVNELGRGEVFGDVLSGSNEKSPVDIVAKSDCETVSFQLDDIFMLPAEYAEEKRIFLRNLILAISNKYFQLNKRTAILEKKSLRSKIARYLINISEKEHSGGCFAAVHSREEMSRYLGCERSALSRELSRMRADGIIEYTKRSFAIIDEEGVRRLAED